MTRLNRAGKYVLVVCPNPSVDIYAQLENFKKGVPNRIITESRYPGGKGLHVAMALAELGINVKVVGFWGGESGEWLRKTCNAYYPAISFCGPKLSEWSRSCYTFQSSNDFNDTEILGTGPEVSESEFEQLLAIVEEKLPFTTIMALCGSWPKGSPETGYRQLIELATDHQVPSFLDCTGPQLENALTAHPYGIHLNRKELLDFTQVADFEKAMYMIRERCAVAAITDGPRGLHYLTGNGHFRSLAKVDKVISTIGSGDCLLAGVIAGHVQQLNDEDTANLGAACGAANCLRPELGMLYEQDVTLLLKNFKK